MVLPALFRCRLTHARYAGTRHSFTHVTYLWLVDVDDLPRLPWPLTRLVRFDARDHLGRRNRSLRANLDQFLALNGVNPAGGRILMLAQPRGLGYAFDPVSFFFCYRPDGSPLCVVSEVRNTFGERHAYLIMLDGALDGATEYEVDKRLYVSPFLPADGRYLMRFSLDDSRLAITIRLLLASRRQTRPGITAVLSGDLVRAPASLAASLLSARRVLSGYRATLLIHWQAWRLRRRGVPGMRRRHHQPQPGVDALPDIAVERPTDDC